jgi:hypothetical protein
MNTRGQIGSRLTRYQGDYYPYLDEFHMLNKRDRAEKILDQSEKDYAKQPMPSFPVKLNAK